jgi:hypothetical protein
MMSQAPTSEMQNLSFAPSRHSSFGPLISGNGNEFHSKLNVESFQFKHNLVGHPLFETDRLAKMSERVLSAGHERSYVLCKVAESVPNISKQWTNFTTTERVAQAIKHIRESGTWIMIAGAQVDPDYQNLLDTLVDELQDLCAIPLRKQMTWLDCTLFIGSPNSVTHFHLDTETNFLFQVHGTKEANLFDQRDRSIVSDQDLEAYYWDRLNALPFREEFQRKAKVIDFKPGTGIHIPVNAPHWVRNLDDYSVTFSVLLYLKAIDRRSWIYQVNHCLRGFGLNPTPPGVSATKDFFKSRLVEVFSPRAPQTKDELLRTGIRRLTKPIRAVAKLRRMRG